MRPTTSRRYTGFLYEYEDDKIPLFDFECKVPPSYMPILVERFYEKFRYKQIGFDTWREFRDRVKSVFLRKQDVYIARCNSVNAISNPFINVIAETEERVTDATRSKMYGTYNSESLNRSDATSGSYSSNYGGSIGGSHTATQNTKNYTDKTKEETRSKHNLSETTRTSDLFTDTPQIQTLGLINTDGTIGTIPVKDDPIGILPWNEGYLTEARAGYNEHKLSEHSENGQGGVAYGDARDSGEVGVHTTNIDSGFTNAGSGSMAKTNTEALSNTEQDTVRANESNTKRIRTGLEGMTVSNVLLEWRTTFINADDEFLDEFEICFLGVY